MLHDYEVMVIRLSMGKQPSQKFVPNCHTGKMNAEKLGMVKDSWVRYLISLHPDHDIVGLSSYIFTDKEVGKQGSSFGDEV